MSEKTLKIVRWVVAGVFAVFGFIALILHFMTKDKTLGLAAVVAVEASHKPAIDAARKRVAELAKDMHANDEEIKAAHAEVAKRKEALSKVYTTTGLSAAEVKARLSRLKL